VRHPPGRATLSIFSRLRLFSFARFSQPASDRPLYQALSDEPIDKILEIGVADGQRATRMIETAGKAGRTITYTGVDRFEDRGANEKPGMALREAYCRLRATGAKVQLVPGDPASALRRLALSSHRIDLLVISADIDQESMGRAWFHVPWMLHNGSRVFVESLNAKGQNELHMGSRAEVDRLAAQAGMAGRRAA